VRTAVWSYQWQWNHGSGLKPRPDPPLHTTTYQFNYNCVDHYNKEHRRVCWLAESNEDLGGYRGHRFKSHGRQTFEPINQKPNSQSMSDTWRPPVGPRVLILFVHKRTRVNTRFDDNRSMKMCHVTPTATSSCWYSLATWSYGLYGLPSERFFYLFDFPNRSLYLSLPTSV
jgi:hypothetical protein